MKNVYNKIEHGLILNIILIILQWLFQHYLQSPLLMVGVKCYKLLKIVIVKMLDLYLLIVIYILMYFSLPFALLDQCFS